MVGNYSAIKLYRARAKTKTNSRLIDEGVLEEMKNKD